MNDGSNTMPEVILCSHEAIGIYGAHGYAAADAIFNAWCDRVPLIVLGGTTPTQRHPRLREWDDQHELIRRNESAGRLALLMA